MKKVLMIYGTGHGERLMDLTRESDEQYCREFGFELVSIKKERRVPQRTPFWEKLAITVEILRGLKTGDLYVIRDNDALFFKKEDVSGALGAEDEIGMVRTGTLFQHLNSGAVYCRVTDRVREFFEVCHERGPVTDAEEIRVNDRRGYSRWHDEGRICFELYRNKFPIRLKEIDTRWNWWLHHPWIKKPVDPVVLAWHGCWPEHKMYHMRRAIEQGIWG